MSDMGRREFVALLGGAAAWPVTVQAQQSERVRQIGVLMGTLESDLDQKGGLDVHTRSRGSWLDGRNEYPYREALGRGQLRSVTDACIGPRTPRSASRAFTSRRTTR